VKTTLVEKVTTLAEALTTARIPYAFGGALALAYATEEPRGTRDIDVNVFVPPDDVVRVFDALPPGVIHGPAEIDAVRREEQVRLWWDGTPVDVFFAAHQFHIDAGGRAREVDFVGRRIRVLAPADLATFKVLFDRSRDWVDIETMIASGALAIDEVIDNVGGLLGDDPRIGRLRDLRPGADE
jgi:hypothetical protein